MFDSWFFGARLGGMLFVPKKQYAELLMILRNESAVARVCNPRIE